MPLWSRSSPQAPPDPTRSPSSSHTDPASSSPPPPGFLANHHRRSSSNLDTARTRSVSGHASSATSAPPSSSSSKPPTKVKAGKRTLVAAQADELGADDEPWDTNSDDEPESTLVARISGVSLHIPSSSSSSSGAPHPSTSAAAAPSPTSPTSASTPTSSSWSFNPFAAARAPPAPVRTASGSSSLSAAEAVAAALSGRSRPGPGPLPQPQRAASYLAGASRVQEEADKVVRAEEKRRSLERAGSSELGAGEVVDEPEEMAPVGEAAVAQEKERTKEADRAREERGEGWAKEQCRRAIRRDVDDLVKGACDTSSRPFSVCMSGETDLSNPRARRSGTCPRAPQDRLVRSSTTSSRLFLDRRPPRLDLVRRRRLAQPERRRLGRRRRRPDPGLCPARRARPLVGRPVDRRV